MLTCSTEPTTVGQKAMKNLSAILQAFRHNLPNSSLTAQAIDRGALLEEISQAAAMERIHQLAAILFEAEQEETQSRSASKSAID